MTYLHLVDQTPKQDTPHWDHPQIATFLNENFPDAPRPSGPIQQGRVRIMPGSTSFVPQSYRKFDHAGTIGCYVWGDHFFLGDRWQTWNPDPGTKDKRGRDIAAPPFKVVQVDQDSLPVTVEILGDACRREIYKEEYNYNNRDRQVIKGMKLDTYGGDYTGKAILPYAYLNMRFSFGDAVPVEGMFKFEQPTYGTAVLDPEGGPEITVTSNFYGMTRTWKESLKFTVTQTVTKDNYYHSRNNVHNVVHDPVSVLRQHLKSSTLPDGKAAWIKRFVDLNPIFMDISAEPTKSLAAVFKKKDIKAVMDRLPTEDPTGFFMFQWLRDGRTKDKRCNNNLLAAMLNAVGNDMEKLKAALAAAWDQITEVGNSGVNSYRLEQNWEKGKERFEFWFGTRREICLTLEGAKERHEDLEAKADFTKQRDLSKAADGLEVPEDKFPLLRAAIVAGSIPISVFVQPNKNPVNREFPIWEKALARKGWSEVLFEIAEDAGRRGTYERDIIPYIAFLFRIEKYLDKHSPTGKKQGWAAMPRYVQSSSELEMNDEDETTGTIKRRSAFTPVADNDKHTVTVPFVAVKVYGAVTQWCYAQHYHVFEEGMTDPISGGVVINDLEVKLNGRDDYGLCFYTLIGSDTATGYPTFLIIFERREVKTIVGPSHPDCRICQMSAPGYVAYPMDRFADSHKACEKCFPKKTGGTFVHFHRVRPCRSKDGIRTTACKLVEACYQFMAGNVPASDIVAQQGDLMFLRCTNDPIHDGAKVSAPEEGVTLEFESHKFFPHNGAGTLSLYVSEAKQPSNRLGYIYAPNGLRVEHPEHDNIAKLVEGWYEIRRAKSYENNPVTIWSRTID